MTLADPATLSTGLLIERLVFGVLLMAHSSQKLFGWFGGYGFNATMASMEHMGIPAPLAFLAIAAEFAGGLGLIVGLLSRVAAFGIGAEMMVAVASVHGANGLFMNWTGNQKGEGFEYHLLALALLALVMVALYALATGWRPTRSPSRSGYALTNSPAGKNRLPRRGRCTPIRAQTQPATA